MTKPRDLATLGGGFTQSGTGAVQRTVEELNQGDIIRLQAYQNTGSALNVSGGTVTQLAVEQLSID